MKLKSAALCIAALCFGEANSSVLVVEVELASLGFMVLPVGLSQGSGLGVVQLVQHEHHTELSIMVPVKYKRQSYYYTVYALESDDHQMTLARDARGSPSKMADFTVNTDGGELNIQATRKGVAVLSLQGSIGGADGAVLPTPGFSDQLNLFGTQFALPPMPFVGQPFNSVYLALSRNVSGGSCVALTDVTLAVAVSKFEPIADLFAASPPTIKTACWSASAVVAEDPDPQVQSMLFVGNPLNFQHFYASYFFKYGGVGNAVPGGITPDPNSKYEWQDGRFVWMTVRVDTAAATALLPPGMTLAKDTADIFMAWYPTALLNKEAAQRDKETGGANFPYHEFGVRLSVEYKKKAYHHVVYILVDDDVPLFLGRDSLGTPKKLADVDFPDSSSFEEGDAVDFTLTRRGRPVISFHGSVGSLRNGTSVPGMTDGMADISVFAGQVPTYANAAKMQHAMPAYIEWAADSEVIENRDLGSGASVAFGDSVEEPLASFLTNEVVDCGFFRMNYAHSGDMRSRPVRGEMPLGDDAERYYQNSYALKYAGAAINGRTEYV